MSDKETDANFSQLSDLMSDDDSNHLDTSPTPWLSDDMNSEDFTYTGNEAKEILAGVLSLGKILESCIGMKGEFFMEELGRIAHFQFGSDNKIYFDFYYKTVCKENYIESEILDLNQYEPETMWFKATKINQCSDNSLDN
ncbi:hypothetical protein [Pelistega sp. MC2]|uniref:hypothetical protein n=1 Tax=Pelistega sp. MC2 TaxID=1720297 RepID=UPI0008D8F9D5|nr:hypothetical protein [Pelistega sp. MC2]